MPVFYQLETQLYLSKASVAKDEKALNALREIEKAYESDMDIVELFDLDEDKCDLHVEFMCPERTHDSADRISDFLEAIDPHAIDPFTVEGENQERGYFVDVAGNRQGMIDEAIKIGHGKAQDALPDKQMHPQLDQAMRYAGERESEAITDLIAGLQAAEQDIPESVMRLIEAPYRMLEKTVTKQ